MLPNLSRGIEDRQKRRKHRDRVEGSVRIEAEMRMMHLKAKAGQGLPSAALTEA